MKALCIWPSKCESLFVPQLNSEIGSSCMTKRKEKRRDLGTHVCHSKCHGRLLISSNSRDFRAGTCCSSSTIELGCGCFSGFSKLKFLLFREPKESYFDSCVALAWATEKQAIGSEFVEDDSNSINGSSGKTESGDVFHPNLVGPKNGENDNEDGKVADVENEKGRKTKSARVDVRALALSLRFAKTVDDVEEVLKDKGELPLQVYSSMIKGFGIEKRLDSAVTLVQWLKRKREEDNGFIGLNLYIFNSLLGAVKQSGQFDKVDKVMNDMALEGVIPNVVTYNTLMAIYLEQGRAAEALDLVEEIQMKDISPSPVSYSTALLAYRRLEDGDGALKFFLELKDKYTKGDLGKDEDWENEFVKIEKLTIQVCYQVMRRWLVKGDILNTNVLKLLTDMDKAGLKPVRSEEERLVWACTNEGHYIVAKELYIRIRQRHSEISLSVCNHVIWLMGKAKKWWAALEIYEDLLDTGPKPNTLSYELIVAHFNILLGAARDKGIWKWGVGLINKMEEKGLKPGSREWNAVLIACSKASEASAAVQIFRRMIEQGAKPTIVSYGALLSALEKGKLYDEAFRVWEHMIKVGVEPNVYAYTILASVCIGHGKFERVDSIIREMVASGIKPTVVTYNAIISGCARNGLGSVAYEWFHRMKVHKISPNEITYEMLIEALAKDGKPRLAYELYLRAQNEGLKLSAKPYDAILRSSEDYSATIDISVLGPRPPDKWIRLKIRKTV